LFGKNKSFQTQVHNPLDVLKIIDAEKLQGSWMPRNSNTTTMEGCAPKTLVQGTVLQVLDKAALKKNTVTSLLWIWMAVERTAG